MKLKSTWSLDYRIDTVAGLIRDRIGSLERENKVLKGKVSRLEAQWNEHGARIQEAKKFMVAFKELVNQYADLSS